MYPLRSSIWLVIDLIDDQLKLQQTEADVSKLLSLRELMLDALGTQSKLEEQLAPPR